MCVGITGLSTSQCRKHRRVVDLRLEANYLALVEGPDVDDGEVEFDVGLANFQSFHRFQGIKAL
jgi:hypothetical protein